ncbi:MAG: signal peptide peptidase SppA [Planctomycetota bacterium]|jgi:protease-4
MSEKFVYCILMVSLLVFVASGCGDSAFVVRPVPASLELQETEIDRDKGWFVEDKIAVIDVDGLMANRQEGGLLSSGDNPVSLFVEKLDKARKDSDVKAVVLRLNSPGGTVGASDIMYHRLQEFKKESRKPVVACMLDVAASGAYYLACGCDGIVAQPTSITGSIGTIIQTISFEGTMKKLGIEAVAIKSGSLKDMASPLRDLSEEEREVLQGIITEFYEQFVKVVDDGRKDLAEEKVRALADGRVYTAKEALEQGLIDRVGYPSDGIAWAKELAGVTKSRVVIYHRPVGYKPNIYSLDTGTGGGVGALINVELPDWLVAEGTQFLYLWQPGVGGD